ncbi:SPOR domain-containing protein [Candidatus Puniceispirillum sp.]|nr:SPOR domain-containing protein [Candidatus Puniceispirillum sp.]
MGDDEQQISSVKWVWFGILAGVVVLVGASIYFVLPSLISKTTNEVRVIKALKGPIKVKPETPGGKTVDHQDLMVVDILKGGVQTDDQTETLRANSSNPEPPPISLAENTAAKTIQNAERSESIISDHGKKTVIQPPELNQDSLASAKTQKVVTKSIDSLVKKNKESEAVPEDSSKDKRGQKNATKTTSSKIRKHVVIIEEKIPLYMIQLAAFRSAERAAEIARILSQKHKSRLTDIDLKTMKVNTGTNGIFHRVVSAPLPRKDADKMCSTLRRSGQDCFIRKHSAISP